MSNGNGNFLECTGLKKRFKLKGKEIEILKGIDFSIKKGELIIILGKSGTGKTTLLSLLAGLERQTEGNIYFKEQDYSNLSNEELAVLRGKQISIICQHYNLIPSWSAYKNVEAALIQKQIQEEERTSKVIELLNKVGLDGRIENLPSELSEGEQQRVAFARAMVTEPELIIADEPTGAVDPQIAKELLNILFKFLNSNDVSLVVSTNMEFLWHIIQNKSELEKEVMQKTGKIYILNNGVLSFIDNFENIFQNEFFTSGGNFYEKFI